MRKGQNFLSNMMHFGDAKSQDKTSFQVGDISFWQNLTLSSEIQVLGTSSGKGIEGIKWTPRYKI